MSHTPYGAIERPEIRHTSLWHQSVTIFRRNLIHIKRMPEMLLDVTIQPVMFVLLFAYVFGSSIDVATPAGYRAFLLAGIMAQTVAFASFIAMALITRVGVSVRSIASWSASPFMTVASIPM